MTLSVILILLFSCKYIALAKLDKYSAQSDYRCFRTRGCRERTAYVVSARYSFVKNQIKVC